MLYGQTITAKVVGTVTDPSGAAIPAATATMTNVETNQERTTTSNAAGNYEFSFLPIGSYTLSVEADGFQKASVSQFALSVDQVARINVPMEIGQVTDTIEVSAEAVVLQTEDATVGTVINQQQLVELPLNGRSFVQLALLTPGVNPGTPGSITVRRSRGAVGQQVGMSANGARDTQNRFYFDGIEAMDLDSYSFSFSPSIDAIQQFKVQSSTSGAEIGGAPGAQVNLMTKSGTNRFHGGAWEFNRNDEFSAPAGFAPEGTPAPRLNRNQFGANIGGPIVRDKTFFFFNWESGRLVRGQGTRTATVPPAAFRNGDFSASSVTIFDPGTGQPFANNMIPASRVRNFARTFLDDFTPLPNANVGDLSAAFNFRAASGSAPIDQDQFITRVDHRLSENNTIYGSYMFNDQDDQNIGFLTPWDNQRGNGAQAQNATIADTHIFSSSIVNEVRFGWHRFFEKESFGTTGDPSLDIANIIGIPGVSTDPRNFGPPNFSTGFNLPGIRGIGPRNRLNQIWQASDNLSINRGNHFLKVGGSFARRNWTFDESVNPRGSFGFDGRTTAGGANPTRDNQFAAFLMGLSTSAQVSVEPFATRMNNFWGSVYAQDDWKLTPDLTINLGVRYEIFTIPNQRGAVANFALNGVVPGFIASEQFLRGVPGFPDTPTGGAVPTNFVNTDKNNFGPRVGFAYKVPYAQDLVIRGGYGVYFTPELTNSFTVLTLNAPIVNTFDFSGTFDQPVQVETAFLGEGEASGRFGAFALDPDLRDSYIQQWNLTVQKRLPASVVLDVAYVGSKGSNLTLAFDGNRPIEVITPGEGVSSVAERRPLDGFSRISTAKSIGSSIYHSLQIKAERRMARGLSFLGAYTWAHSLSNADISTVGGGRFNAGIQDFFNLNADRSDSAFDIRHRLSIAALYDLPFFNHASSSKVRTLLGGWQLGTISTFQTGFASALTGVGDTTGTGVNSRVSVAPGQQEDPGDRTRLLWFNTAAFTETPLGQFGNAARLPIHLPGLIQIDLSATKNFRFQERFNVQFRTEFFNAFNHVNLGAPGLNIRAPSSFGVITTSSQREGVPNDARIIQFGLKLQF